VGGRGRRPRRAVYYGGATGLGAPIKRSAPATGSRERPEPSRSRTEATTTARACRRVWRSTATTRDSHGDRPMSGDRTPSDSERDSHDFRDVVVVGGGVAGLSTAVFTARQGLDTLVIDDGGSLLRRNAHLENFPGFPLGVDARRLLDLLAEQATDRAPTGSTAVRREWWRRSVRARASKPEATKRSTTPGSSLRSTVTTRTTPATPATRPEPGTSSPRRKTRSVTSRAWRGRYPRPRQVVRRHRRARPNRRRRAVRGRPARGEAASGRGVRGPRRRGRRDDLRGGRTRVLPRLGRTRGVLHRPGPAGAAGLRGDRAAERREREEASREAIRERFAAPHPDPQETHPSLEE